MIRWPRHIVLFLLAVACSPVSAQDNAQRTDFLSFAQGAIPLLIGGDPAARSTFEHAVRVTDGAMGGFTYTTLIDPAIRVEFVYELPALTTFDRFAVPNVLETPSPSQTFARHVEVLGSVDSATDGFVPLAAVELATHAGPGEFTELNVTASIPVRWIKLVLHDGIDVQRDRMFLEFSEIIGNGTQEPAPLVETFGGGWRGRGVAMLLDQRGALVAGCYDRTGDLEGTVTGSILRATGIGRDDGIRSAFIAVIGNDGALMGVRSTNGAPFALFNAEATDNVANLGCSDPVEPVLGCGSVIHGINFDFDSAAIRPESLQVIDALFEGLQNEAAGSIVIEGHTSSEGSEGYNQSLSEQRAAAVRDELIGRGIEAPRIGATGIGELRPIASNDDESGRSLNRRVEVHCGE